MKVLIRTFDERLQRLSPGVIFSIGLVYVLALGGLDCVTPPEMSFTLFYLLGIAFVAWGAGKWHATAIAAAATVVLSHAEWASPRTAMREAIILWNTSTHLIVFTAAAWLASEATRLARHLGSLVEERTARWKAEAQQHKATSARLAEMLERFEQAESLLRAQRDVGISLSLTSDLAAALDRLLEIVVQLEGIDCGGVYLLDPATGEMRLATHRGVSAAFAERASRVPPDAPPARLAKAGQPVYTPYHHLPGNPDPVEDNEHLRAVAFLPLCHEGTVLGSLNLASHTGDEVPARTRVVIEAIAAQAAGAIARIRTENALRRLERQILEISDREQARIGQEIHDGLCQQLVSLAFDANALEAELSSARRPEAATAKRIADYLDQAITESRQLSRGLFPIRLETEGLPSALEELAYGTGERFGVPCLFKSSGPVIVKNHAMAIHLYRIAQEAVNNAVKHSRPRTISILLRSRADQIELRIEDDGAGLASEAPGRLAGMGLHIMDYRARSIGGTLHVGRGPGGGTAVCCCAPCPQS
jgi:signal transduction histidine kinase